MSELEIYGGPPLVRVEIIDGELIGPGVVCEVCGEFHSYIEDRLIICCECGHAHVVDGFCHFDAGPCGSYLCCIN